MRCHTMALLVAALSTSPLAQAAERPDLVIADFEGKDYGAWKTTGTAFGSGPARGTLPGQMAVTGYLGKGLVNSFYKGDGSTGTLTSPPLRIERQYVAFLIGGGHHPGQTCINLRIGGRVVRTATGPNDRPGGTERLDWHSWDVGDLAGKQATIEIVDRETGGWGHINIDQIIQSDRPHGVTERQREIVLTHPYLAFCFAPGQGPTNRVRLVVQGRVQRHAAGPGRATPSWLSWDVSAFRGEKAQLNIEEAISAAGKGRLASTVRQGGRPRGVLFVTDRLYEETYRPQFHFTPATNWMNDPNGLVYDAGEYHLFFQHNPHGIHWGNMTWGHAVSRDLLHWKQLADAIRPDKLGTIFSGSAVVDSRNTTGFKTGRNGPLVCIYTSAGKSFTQSIAWSNDHGRTWSKYAHNPVLGHQVGENRDPKVFWHEPSKKWVMALYLDKSDYALFGSPDLKQWTKLCDVAMPGSSECPDFFPLAVDGESRTTRWVFWGANGHYRLGAFDGTIFKPETAPLQALWGANDYAAQTYNGVPTADGRRLQIAWMAGGSYPEMPFNQQMTFPRELSLHRTADGIRLCMRPAREIAALRTGKNVWKDVEVKPGDNPLAKLTGELWDLDAKIALQHAAEVMLRVRGVPIRYDVRTSTLHCLGRSAPVPAPGRILDLRILVDRTSIEIFADGGRVTMCSCFLPDLWDRSLAFSVTGGPARLRSFTAYELKPAWRTQALPVRAGTLEQ